MSTPQSTIYICSGVRLDNRYEHSIYFASPEAQEEYFAGKVVKTFPAYSYLRKSWPLQVTATMEEAKTWSYLYFHNGTGKTYYYFIVQIEYKNDNMVELTLELDVLQTYLFDFRLLDCFVERNHTTTDIPGEHTVDEGLETGALINNGNLTTDTLKDLCILVLASINPNSADTEEPVPALSNMFNNVFSGLKVWAVNATDWPKLGNQLDDLAEAGFLDGIVTMWMYPKNLVTLGGENTWTDNELFKTVAGAGMTGSVSPGNAPTVLDGYTPKNNKLLCYPYNFLYVTNNSGECGVYRYERYNGGYRAPDFKVYGTVSPDASVVLVPTHYNGVTVNYDEGITLGNFPTCAWDADVYKMWLAQNQNQHKLNEVSNIAGVGLGAALAIGSIATGHLAGAGAGIAMMVNSGQQIQAQLAQKADMAIQPPQARGSYSANVNVSAGKQNFTFYYRSVDAEHARAIDDFFTMYGYKVNRVQKPNIHARPSYTYVKTLGCHIQGNMCTEDTTRIEAIFDNGVTFWVDGDRIADYSQDNATNDTPGATPVMPIYIARQPESVVASVGSTVNFTVDVEGEVASYQWEYKGTFAGSQWANTTATGNQTNTVTLTVGENHYSILLRCKITGKDGTVLYSDVVGPIKP